MGIRVSECANLTVDAVDFQASVLLVHGKEIKIAMCLLVHLQDALKDYLGECRALLMTKYQNIRMSLLIIMVNKSRQQGLNMS